MGHGWCRSPTRMAIYIRDNFTCAYCGGVFFLGFGLSLDHIIPKSKGGDNSSFNLITSCRLCNERKGKKTTRVWYAVLRKEGVDTTKLKHWVYRHRRMSIDREQGGKLHKLKVSLLADMSDVLGDTKLSSIILGETKSCRFKPL